MVLSGSAALMAYLREGLNLYTLGGAFIAGGIFLGTAYFLMRSEDQGKILGYQSGFDFNGRGDIRYFREPVYSCGDSDEV